MTLRKRLLLIVAIVAVWIAILTVTANQVTHIEEQASARVRIAN